MKTFIERLMADERGQSLTEYALLLSIIAVGVVATVILLKDKIVAVFNDVITKLGG